MTTEAVGRNVAMMLVEVYGLETRRSVVGYVDVEQQTRVRLPGPQSQQITVARAVIDGQRRVGLIILAVQLHR
jgi:hypothetical protein